MKKLMDKKGEVLVAVMNQPRDFEIAQEQGWYRIPVDKAPKRWPPQWLAFYQTKIFGEEAFSVRHYARVADIKVASRRELFPDEPENPKSKRTYYQVCLERMERLPAPVFSRKFRRLVFIPTTYEKFTGAVEINDFFDESPLEDRLWAELKRREYFAERQYRVRVNSFNFFLDFALFCRNGNLNVETDGDVWHSQRDRIAEDNQRDNYLTAAGWRVLRFNSEQIKQRLIKECLATIAKTVALLGGLQDLTSHTTRALSFVEPRQLELWGEGFVESPEEIVKLPEKLLLQRKRSMSTSVKMSLADKANNQAKLFSDSPKIFSSKKTRRRR